MFRLEQQPAVPQFSTSQSPHHQVFSPSSNPSTYQSPPGPSTSLSPHPQVFSPSPNPSSYQSLPNPTATQSPHHEINSPSSLDQFSVQFSQDNFLELPTARASQRVITDSGEIKIIND